MNRLNTVKRWAELSSAEQTRLLERPAVSDSPDTISGTRKIIAKVRAEGDRALLDFAQRFDGADLSTLKVSDAEITEARESLSEEARAAIETAITNVRAFHEAQQTAPVRVETSPGVVCERVVRPVPAVGLYVPAGSAPLPSTAIMLSVPAAIAGNPVRVLCTPPRPDGKADPAVLYAASQCGVTDIFKCGGAQAVAAMAYGTESVPKVDKIFGPGNAWVTAAKAEVSADPAGAAQDMPAGPTEVLVLADETAVPRSVALDLLSQAEHGADSHVVLVTTDATLADKVSDEIETALKSLSRREIMEESLQHSLVVLADDREEAVAISNQYAPEHLIVQMDDARALLPEISCAGSIFLGPWTPESVGDYCSGTNHVLPTYGYARSYSGLSLRQFQNEISVQELSEEGLQNLGPTVMTLAGLEGLDAHGQAVAVRINRD